MFSKILYASSIVVSAATSSKRANPRSTLRRIIEIQNLITNHLEEQFYVKEMNAIISTMEKNRGL